jgi:hypothetical protein
MAPVVSLAAMLAQRRCRAAVASRARGLSARYIGRVHAVFGVHDTHAEAAAARCPGHGRLGRRRAEGRWVGPPGSTQLDRIRFVLFRIYF